ncbi:MAG: T9SS type A sorting domain-containing protein [Bacteroidales bacterium]|nr:T9SS type A sorting domain-containing protein [Bacteroidales bacterium]
MKGILLLIFVGLTILSNAQTQKSFFVVHCDPNETQNFPSLERLIDSANFYNIKATIEFTSFWVDSIIDYPERLNKLSTWQTQGHEIAMHHHEVQANGMWDGFSNLSMAEIHEADRDTLKYKGTTDSLYNYIQQITPIEIVTCGTEDDGELPGNILYKTFGTSVDQSYSNAEIILANSNFYCSASHAFLYSMENIVPLLNNLYNISEDYKILGANTHVYNFVTNPEPVIEYFKLINNLGLESLTIKQIMASECNCGTIEKEEKQKNFAIYPNPFENLITIRCNSTISGTSDYDITNVEGLKIKSGRLTSVENTINISHLETGIYFLRIQFKDSFEVYKLIKAQSLP